MPAGYWRDCSCADFPPADPERAVALLPVSAVEQHGPHLPLATDAVIGEGVVTRLLERGVGDVTLLVLPAMEVGDSVEHTGFPGTLCIDARTLLDAWLDVGRSVARAGVRKLVLFNSHGGNGPLVDLAAVRLRAQCAMLVARAASYRLGVPPDLFAADELAHGLHGGEVETSLMLHLRPDLVRLDKAVDFRSRSIELAEDFERIGPLGPVGFAWATQDLHPSGACGNAAAADAEKGRLLLDHLARALAEILAETARFPLAHLSDPA